MGGAVDEGAVHGICWSIGRFQEVSENAGGNKSAIANYTNYARKLSEYLRISRKRCNFAGKILIFLRWRWIN